MPYGMPVQTKKNINFFPLNIGNWAGQDLFQQQEELPSKTDEYLYRRYVNDKGESFFVYIGYWGKYRHGADVLSGRHIRPAYRWDLISEKKSFIEFKGKRIPIKEVIYSKDRHNISILYWYFINKGVIRGNFWGRIKHGVDAILHRKTNIALVRISSQQFIKQESDETDRNQREFAQKIFSLLEEFLPFDQ